MKAWPRDYRFTAPGCTIIASVVSHPFARSRGVETVKKALVPTLLVVITLVAYNQATSQQSAKSREESMDKSAAATYEHLATAIIAIEQTEDELVKSILLGYHAAAQGHLNAAVRDEAHRAMHLEDAAAEVANIANEGDKRIQAVRQRLAKAGHTHNTDAVTKEDYMFINSKEKKDLVALAQRIGQMGAAAKTADVKTVQDELANAFDKAIAPE
jgi:hypothetical protein